MKEIITKTSKEKSDFKKSIKVNIYKFMFYHRNYKTLICVNFDLIINLITDKQLTCLFPKKFYFMHDFY